MTLVVVELFDGITFPQKFRIKKSVSVAHIRPWIIKWQTPTTGELVLQIYKDGELLAESVRDHTEINAEITSTWFHGQLRFDFDALQLNHDTTQEWTEYEMRLFMRNHTTDSQNFYGAIRRYEQKFYDTYGDDVISGEAPNDMVEPLGFELFEWEQ